MKKLFSTESFQARDRYRVWREVTRERFVPTEQKKIGDATFDGMLEAADVGGLLITRSTFGAHAMKTTPLTIRRHNKQHTLAVTLRLSGEGPVSQFDRTTIQRPGDFMVLDSATATSITFPDPAKSLLIELPRERLESVLGSVRLYAALTIDGGLPSACLARTFLSELVRVQKELSTEAAAQMTNIAVDLLVASIAERLARETPRPLQGTVIVQRAKAYIEAHLSDTTLDPSSIAAAVGVSVRTLQNLFHERGRHISDWIWKRRLEVAAQRLNDPGFLHVSIGNLAYGCGFTSQSHFARRFRDHHGVSPTEYRQAWSTSGFVSPGKR